MHNYFENFFDNHTYGYMVLFEKWISKYEDSSSSKTFSRDTIFGA
jgi:hypothetical protein